MYLNIGSNGKSLNKIIGEVNGVKILQYGHVNERYFKRISRIQKQTGVNKIKFDNIIKYTKYSIVKNFDKCVTKDNTPVRNVVYSNLNIKCGGKTFIIEIAVLVKSTKVEWSDAAPKEVAKDYKKYVEQSKLNIGDTVVAIETIAATVKCKGEDRISFTEMNVIDTIRTPHYTHKMTVSQFKYITDNIIHEFSMRTYKAYNQYKKVLSI